MMNCSEDKLCCVNKVYLEDAKVQIIPGREAVSELSKWHDEK